MAVPEQETMNVAAAAALIAQTQDQARRELQVRLQPVYAAWGVAWLAGTIPMWLSVRGQHPFRGPSALAALPLVVLIIAAAVVTTVCIVRASSGVGGGSALRGRLYGLSWPIGFAAYFAITGAVGRFGASGAAQGVLGAAGPLLLVGLSYLVAGAMFRNITMFCLGGWLELVAAVGAQTGPVTILAVEAVAASAGFFAAALLTRPRPS